VDSSEKTHTLHFVQTAPGRYEAEVSAKGSLFGKVFEMKDGAIQESSIVQSIGVPGREHESGPQGRERLQQLTGKLIDSPEELHLSNQTSQDIQPLQKQLLQLAVFLFLIDVAARKIDFRTLKFASKKADVSPAELAASPFRHLKERKKTIGKPSITDLDQILAATEQKSGNISVEPVAKNIEEASQDIPPQDSSEYMKRLKEAKRRKS
jgi:hypothetical protein